MDREVLSQGDDSEWEIDDALLDLTKLPGYKKGVSTGSASNEVSVSASAPLSFRRISAVEIRKALGKSDSITFVRVEIKQSLS